jgi:hypothetical protein
VLAYNEQYGQHPCADCGQPVWRTATLCGECYRRRRNARRREIQQRWLAGESLKEIAAALGTTPASVRVTLVKMRERGWEMPHRRPRKGKGTAGRGAVEEEGR